MRQTQLQRPAGLGSVPVHPASCPGSPERTPYSLSPWGAAVPAVHTLPSPGSVGEGGSILNGGLAIPYDNTFICTRQVGCAILTAQSEEVLTSTLQSKSTRRGRDTAGEQHTTPHDNSTLISCRVPQSAAYLAGPGLGFSTQA